MPATKRSRIEQLPKVVSDSSSRQAQRKVAGGVSHRTTDERESVFVGGGVQRGCIHGSTDAKGYSPASDPMTVGDFHATIAYAAALAIEQEFMTPTGRPMTIGNKGKPAKALFA